MTTFRLSNQVVNNGMNFARGDVVGDHLRG
jgi:hypothetical protein